MGWGGRDEMRCRKVSKKVLLLTVANPVPTNWWRLVAMCAVMRATSRGVRIS